MNHDVERALRALADAGIGTRLPESPDPGPDREWAKANPPEPRPGSETAYTLPESVLTARHPLAELCRLTLEGNPAASKLTKDDRQWIAEHLERAVLNWLKLIIQPETAWTAQCPKGHLITDGVFARSLLGWCCSECKQVYSSRDCKLVTE